MEIVPYVSAETFRLDILSSSTSELQRSQIQRTGRAERRQTLSFNARS